MPGILYHLAFGNAVYENCKNILTLDKKNFMSGNLIPDFATANKNETHFQIPASVEGFFIPDLEVVKRNLYDIHNDVKFGMYCHLYLDTYFIRDFLIPEFIWDAENMQVINPRNHKTWTVKEFFSHNGMYGSYTEINQLMLKNNHIPTETLNLIPEILPETGIKMYDKRKDKTWKQELEEYMNQKKEYTGDVFNYERLWSFIEKTALQFSEELRKELES